MSIIYAQVNNSDGVNAWLGEVERHNYLGWGFTVSVPVAVDVTKRIPVQDFELYAFTDASKAEILSAYAGSNPEFGKFAPKHVKAEPFVLNGLG